MLTDDEIFKAVEDAPLAGSPGSFVLAIGRAIEAKVLEKQAAVRADLLDLIKDYGRYRDEGLHESAERELAAIEQALSGPLGVAIPHGTQPKGGA